MEKNKAIPKIIHYCWFGGNELPELAKKCIDSWKLFFPDYEIIQWSEANFDIHCCKYVEEAYHEKKWSHVSDYARFWVLYNYGGLYFDTDVEVIKPFEDILHEGSFMGNEKAWLSVAPGLCLGVYPKHPIYESILKDYKNDSFYDENGQPDLFNTVVVRTTKILKECGIKDHGNMQIVSDITIYPKDYFCPLEFNTRQLNVNENTHSIHWYDASWFPEDDKHIHEMEVKIRNKYKGKKVEILCLLYRKSYRLRQKVKEVFTNRNNKS